MSRPGQATYRFKGGWRGSKRKATLALTGGRCALCGNPGTDGKGKGLHQAHLVTANQMSTNENDAPAVPLCRRCHRSFDAGRS